MAYADQEMSGSRIVSIVIVALIHVVVGYLLVTGLAISAVQNAIQRVTTVDIEEPEPEEEEPPPPPPDQDVVPPPPVAPPAPINVSIAPPPIRTTDTPPPPAPIAVRVPPPAPVAAPAPPPAPSQARPARAENRNRWVQRIMDNYPRRAQSRGIEGSVGMNVTIDASGRISACSVNNSSGSDDLDQAACEGMQRFARYEPALDAAGNPISSSMSQTIQYRLSE
jgi:periplasmic protein TonB